MCGIYGVIQLDGANAPADALRAMGLLTHHRGPDDEGQHVDGPAALGMRRLSIIDVGGGHQPLTNEDGTLWLVANGEIYNFRELRASLEAALRLVYAPADRWPAPDALKQRLPYPYLLWLSRYGFHHTRHVVFDHLVAPKAEYLTRESVAAWFEHAGLRDTTITARNANSWRGYGRRPAPAQA